MHMVNWQQLFNLQKSPGDNLLHPAPHTYLPIMLMQKLQNTKTPQLSHLYGTQVKNQSRFCLINIIFIRMRNALA